MWKPGQLVTVHEWKGTYICRITKNDTILGKFINEAQTKTFGKKLPKGCILKVEHFYPARG